MGHSGAVDTPSRQGILLGVDASFIDRISRDIGEQL